MWQPHTKKMKTNEEIKLTEIRNAVKTCKNFNGVIKGYYANRAESEILKRLLPANKQVVLTMCKQFYTDMKIGEEYKITIKGVEHTRTYKFSEDMVNRWLCKHQAEIAERAKTFVKQSKKQTTSAEKVAA